MNSSSDLASQAVAHAQAGDFATAAAGFAAAIKLEGDDAALHEQHAQCLMELEQYEPAAMAAAHATTLQPCWPDAWLTLARALLNDGRLQGAHDASCKCLELDPQHADAQEDLAAIRDLLQQQTGHAVGLPGLVIQATPGGQVGPGCVIWEAGVQLARLFVQLAAVQQQGGCAQATGSQEALPRPSCQQRCTPAAAGASCCAAPAVGQLERVSLEELPGLQGARVLELGAGTGIAGIAAAACGAHVLLTDLPEAQQLLLDSIARNQQLVAAGGGSAAAAVLDWNGQQQQLLHQHFVCSARGEAGTGPQASVPAAAWGFGADLVFNAAQIKPVVHAVVDLLRRGAADGFVLAHKQRHPAVDDGLLQALAAETCLVRQVDRSGALPDSRICMWLITLA